MQKKILPEEMLIIGVLAAFMAGYIDAYTYVLYKGFANRQTGNIILLTIALFDKEWSRALFILAPITTFFSGIFIFETIKKYFIKHYIRISLFIQAILVLIVGFGAFKGNNIIVSSIISFICSLQLVSFKKVNGNAYATIMHTGNLRSFSEYISKWILHKDKENLKVALTYLFIIFMFCLGIVFGMILVNLIGVYAILIVLVNIIIKYILLHINYKKYYEVTTND